MKKAVLVLSLLILYTSCGSVSYVKNFLKARLTVQQAIDLKVEMDNSDNPAFKFEREKELKKKRIKIEGIKVQDIVTSSNVDYRFCVIVTVPTDKGNIDCYIYAGAADIFPKEDLKIISKLVKGKTIIDVEGDFSSFFTLLDETYTKIEIINADINIKEG